jgi:hypothetical protein
MSLATKTPSPRVVGGRRRLLVHNVENYTRGRRTRKRTSVSVPLVPTYVRSSVACGAGASPTSRTPSPSTTGTICTISPTGRSVEARATLQATVCEDVAATYPALASQSRPPRIPAVEGKRDADSVGSLPVIHRYRRQKIAEPAEERHRGNDRDARCPRAICVPLEGCNRNCCFCRHLQVGNARALGGVDDGLRRVENGPWAVRGVTDLTVADHRHVPDRILAQPPSLGGFAGARSGRRCRGRRTRSSRRCGRLLA